jgi:DNA-binding MarR family transcriptional regulator
MAITKDGLRFAAGLELLLKRSQATDGLNMTQILILLTLLERGDRTAAGWLKGAGTTRAISAAIASERTAVAMQISKLRRSQLVEKVELTSRCIDEGQANGVDGRTPIYDLTRAGRLRAAKLEQVLATMDRAFASLLSSREHDFVAKAFEAFRRTLRTAEPVSASDRLYEFLRLADAARRAQYKRPRRVSEASQ